MADRAAVSILDRNPSYVGGLELLARELSQQLGEHGWCSILVYRAEPCQAVSRLLDLPNVSVEVLPATCAQTPRALRDLGGVLRRYRPEVVHMQLTPMVGLHVPIARAASGGKVYYTDQFSRPEHYRMHRAAPHKRLVGRLLAAPLSRVPCASDFGRRCLVAQGIVPERKLMVNYNAVDLERAESGERGGEEARRRLAIPTDRIVVAQTSWMIPAKGWTDLLSAARIVLARCPDVHFLMVGEGPNRAEYEAMAADLGIATRVTWAGSLDDPLGSGVCAAADIWCQVSRWQELFGFTIAEAMAAGRPVVGTRTGGIPEVIEDGVTGYLVEPGNAGDIADRILELARDAGLRQQMGCAGKARAADRFSLKKNVAQLLEVYGIAPGGAAGSA